MLRSFHLAVCKQWAMLTAARLLARLPRSHLSQLSCRRGSANVATALQPVERPKLKALLVDAAGTLLSPSEPAAHVYLRYGQRYGVQRSEDEVLAGFRRAYNRLWSATPQRYVGDGRVFWRAIVQEATGCPDADYFEDVYLYFARPEAWTVSAGAVPALQRLRAAGIRLACVSNFDSRLRPLLHALELAPLFDSIVVSAEVGTEKPNPLLFELACQQLGVEPEEAVHVGDDRRNDVFGARDAGCFAWLWGLDVTSFDEVADLVLANEVDPDHNRA